MSLYRQFKTDKNVERDGIVLNYGMNTKKKPIEIRIARAGGANNRYTRLLEAAIKPYRRQLQNETMDNDVAEEITMRVYAQSVILGWSGVEFPVLNENGEPTEVMEEKPYSVDNCVRLFKDLPDLWSDIQSQATRAALFRQDILEADAKN